MKKSVSFILALSMLLAVLLSVPAFAEDERKHVNIRFTQFGNSTDDLDGLRNDAIKKAIEDRCNITLEYDTGTDGFMDRLQTELYIGVGADLVHTFGESDKISKYIEEELVYKLSDIVNAAPERYPFLYKMMNSPEYKIFNKVYSGNPEDGYAIYSVYNNENPPFGGIPVYNTKILNEVTGGKVPETVDEFIDFTKKCSEAGYVGWWPRNNKLTSWVYFDQTLAVPQGTSIQAPVGDPWTGCVMEGTLGVDEKWKIAATSEKSKEVVRQLAEMYKAGGLDQSIGIKGDFDDAYADFAAGKIGSVDFGFGVASQYNDFFKNPWKAAHPGASPEDITLGTALTQDGDHGKIYTIPTWMSYHYFIPTTCKYPERVLDLLEFLLSTEGQDLLFNTENYKYRENPDKAYWASVTEPYGYSDGRIKYVWFIYLFSGNELELDLLNRDWWDAITHPIDNSDKWASEEDMAVINGAKEKLSPIVDKKIVKLPIYYLQVVVPDEATGIRNKLSDITNEYLTQMIGGKMDIDEGWPKYVKAYEDAGAATLEKMINDAVSEARNNVSTVS